MNMYEKICPNCKKVFYRDRDRTAFCSSRCANIFNKTSFKKGHTATSKGEKSVPWVKRWCLNCNKSFESPEWRKYKFCSVKCSAIFNGKKIRGNKNKFWKGGITTIRYQILNLRQYRRWRKAVFERDDYTCQLCGQHGGFLNADHHKVTFSELVNIAIEKFGIEEVLKELPNFDEFWDLSNGRTLCVKCHRKTPSFGGRNNIRICV